MKYTQRQTRLPYVEFLNDLAFTSERGKNSRRTNTYNKNIFLQDVSREPYGFFLEEVIRTFLIKNSLKKQTSIELFTNSTEDF